MPQFYAFSFDASVVQYQGPGVASCIATLLVAQIHGSISSSLAGHCLHDLGHWCVTPLQRDGDGAVPLGGCVCQKRCGKHAVNMPNPAEWGAQWCSWGASLVEIERSWKGTLEHWEGTYCVVIVCWRGTMRYLNYKRERHFQLSFWRLRFF